MTSPRMGITTLRTVSCMTALAAGSGLAHGQKCGASFYCPSCASIPPLVVSSSASGLNVSMKWSILNGSPSLINPSWGFCPPGTFKDMLWRRHERASNCVWIPQAKINLRSGAIPYADLMGNYFVQADADTTVGLLGDIDIVSSPKDEWIKALIAADTAWKPFTGGVAKGIVAISANRLTDGSGTFIARGVAILGTINYPYLIMADPDELCQRDERSLAHEVGHVLSLGHSASGLMQSGGTGNVLTATQANTARAYLIANLTQLDPPIGLEVGRLDAAIDGFDDMPQELEHLDVIKATVVDLARLEGEITFAAATGAPYRRGQQMQMLIALDTDNDPATGSPMRLLAPGMEFPGADFALEMQLDPEGRPITGLYRSIAGIAWAAVELLPGQIVAGFAPIDRLVCDPTPQFEGPERLTIGSEAVMAVTSTLISSVGPGGAGPAFPRGLRFQVAMLEAPGAPLVDLGPATPAVMMFPELLYPELFGQRRVTPGSNMGVRVTRLPALRGVKAFLGPRMIPLPGVTTDAQGSANFLLPIPADMPLGLTGLTVGVDDPELAVTADRGVEIVLCEADLNNDGQVDFIDYLEFLNYYDKGQEPADINGDGLIDFTDYLDFLNLYEAGC